MARKWISLLVATTVGALLSVTASTGAAAHSISGDGGYPHASAHYVGPGDWRVDEDGDGDYTDGAPIYEWYSERMYWYRNCTDYVAWKLESLGVATTLTRGNGDGGSWGSRFPERTTETAPQPGMAAVWSGSPGHVAFVEAVNSDGTIVVSEYNHHNDGNYHVRSGTMSALGVSHFVDFGLQGYGPGNAAGMNDLAWREQSNLFSLAGTGSTQFVLGGNTTGIGSPSWIGTGDFDSDGRMNDLAWYQNGTIFVLNGTGNGNFTIGGSTPGIGSPSWAGVGDFDSDGKVDDLAWREGTNLYVLRGDNANKFVLGGNTTGIGNPKWAGVGDFDADGKLDDLAWYQGTTIYVLRGTGASKFTIGGATPGIGTPAFASVGEFNY